MCRPLTSNTAGLRSTGGRLGLPCAAADTRASIHTNPGFILRNTLDCLSFKFVFHQSQENMY